MGSDHRDYSAAHLAAPNGRLAWDVGETPMVLCPDLHIECKVQAGAAEQTKRDEIFSEGYFLLSFYRIFMILIYAITYTLQMFAGSLQGSFRFFSAISVEKGCKNHRKTLLLHRFVC